MAHAELAVTVVCGMLAVVVVLLSYRLARTNILLAAWANKCLEHSMAWSEEQRIHMRAKLEEDRGELLLREQRAAAGVRLRATPEGHDDGMDIRVPTGIVTD